MNIEIEDISNNNIIRHNLENKRPDQRQLISYLRSEAYSICRTQISYEYIKWSFNKFKRGFIYYKDNVQIAFCIWKVNEHIKNMSILFKELYIYLICGKQLDYKLIPRILDDIINLCRKSNIQYITLEPANNTLKEYYMKCGFKERIVIGNKQILELDVNSARIITKSNKTYKFKTRKRRII